VLSLVRHTPISPKLQAGSDGVSIEVPAEGKNAAVPLKILFPPGEGWKTITVTLTW
jgi:hypothetical protein